AQNQTVAQNVLLDLSGSVDSIHEGFSISGSKNPTFLDYRDEKEKRRDYHQRDWTAFVKDDWKIRPDLTLNIGVRYEFFGVPWEANGLMAAPVGGNPGLYGISAGSLTNVQFVGKNSPNPNLKVHKDDWNNFGPAVGVSWDLPWFGRGKTVLRAGYGVNYNGAPRFNQIDTTLGIAPGTNLAPQPVPTAYTNLSTVANLLPVAKTAPLQPLPLNDRTQNMYLFDSGYVIPYIQNFNVELQRQLTKDWTLDVRYVGTKGTRLYAGVSINEVNIFENGILDAFKTTRAGGNAPLFDRMLAGVNLPGAGVVNGTTLTGSAALRQNTTTRSFIANGNVGALANFLNTTPSGTGSPGGLLRNAGLPENFIVTNPQFLNVELSTNPDNSTYHSLVTQVTKRFSHGFTNQMSYTWSRSLGVFDSDGGRNTTAFSIFRLIDPRNRRENKTLINHRTHDIRGNATWQLPFGPQQKLLGNSNGVIARLVERWQLGAIYSWNSGTPLTLLSARSTITAGTTITPDIAGNFTKNMGDVTRINNGVTYFRGLTQVTDPDRANVTTLQSTQGSFSGSAIADAGGHPLLVNAPPGRHGNMGLNWIEGPANLGLDMNLIKRIRIAESKEFEFRLDALSVLNHANFGNPDVNINSNTFGRITSATGNRTFVANLRLNF
ncbi:MAG TPA: TonB-dependent receptor, partial [Terriglobia bacterium]|nr:TonB-dependent receptor [Terriglobia bacterium]